MRRSEVLARIHELGARVLADPSDAALAERLATARLLFEQATTPAALAEVSALVAETVPVTPRPAPRRYRRRGRPRRAASRRFTPRAVAVAANPGWWRRPGLAVAACAAILFATATSAAGDDVVAHRITVTVAEVALGVAVVWLLTRAWPEWSAHRTRRAVVEARLNEIASRVLSSPTEEEAERYALLLHTYETKPLAEVERLLEET